MDLYMEHVLRAGDGVVSLLLFLKKLNKANCKFSNFEKHKYEWQWGVTLFHGITPAPRCQWDLIDHGVMDLRVSVDGTNVSLFQTWIMKIISIFFVYISLTWLNFYYNYILFRLFMLNLTKNVNIIIGVALLAEGDARPLWRLPWLFLDRWSCRDGLHFIFRVVFILFLKYVLWI